MRTHILFFFLIAVSVESGASETRISGKVIQVFDGNTLEVSSEHEGSFRIILQGIDCPELTQEFGVEAKQFLEKRLLHRNVIVYLHGKDRLRNYIGVVLLDDNLDVRFALLGHGLAWTSEKDPQPELEVIRLEAAGERKGLWAQDQPTPPWMYRREQSMSAPKSR